VGIRGGLDPLPAGRGRRNLQFDDQGGKKGANGGNLEPEKKRKRFGPV